MWSQILANTSNLNRLQSNEFRRSISLSRYDKIDIQEFGMREMQNLAYNLINKNLKIKPKNDGKQTPEKGNPVFVAQHATATCCRKCLFKWYRIPPYRELTDKEVDFTVNLIIKWIAKQF